MALSSKIINILFIVFWGFIIAYISDLEKKCECSKDWRRDYIKYYSYIIIPILLITMFIDIPHLPTPFVIASLAIILTTILISISYINDLRKKKCECSEKPTRTALEIVSYIQISVFILFVLYMMYKMIKP